MIRVTAVFVHGIFSSAEAWTELTAFLGQNEFVKQNVDLVTFSYPSPKVSLNPLKRIPDLSVLAQEFDTFLKEGAKTAEAPRLVLIGHSQGGLVILYFLAQLLREGRARELGRVAQCLFFSTPTNGSELLLSVRRGLGQLGLWHHPQEESLRPLARDVADVQRTVLRQAVYAPGVTASTCPVTIRAYAGDQDGVVTPHSARWVFTDSGTLPGTHSTIIRPRAADAEIVRIISGAFQSVASNPIPIPDTETLRTVAVGIADKELLDRGLSIQSERFEASQTVRRDDVAYWLRHYEQTFQGISVHVFVALRNDDVRGFLMFHADTNNHLIVVDYIAMKGQDAVDQRLMLKLLTRLREVIDKRDIRGMIFEVRQGDDRESAARIRLFSRYGAQVLKDLRYEAIDMDRFPEPDATMPYLIMYATPGPPPASLSRREAETLVDYLYGTWYCNWLSRKWKGREEELRARLGELAERVKATIPSGRDVALS